MQPKADVLIGRGWAARREGRHADARRDLSTAVSLCRQNGDPDQLVRALGRLAHVEWDLNRPDVALTLYQEAVEIGREGDDPLLLAHAVRHVGDVHLEAGRLDLAEPCYEEALSLYRDHSSPPALDFANAVRRMALLKEARNEAEDARRFWTEARDLYTACGVEAGVAESSAHLERETR